MEGAAERRLIVERGAVRSHRFFDLGDEIVLADVERSLRASSFEVSTTPAEGTSLERVAVPLEVDLGLRPVALPVTRRTFEAARVTVLLYAYGSMAVRIDLDIQPGSDLQDWVAVCSEVYESSALLALAREVARELRPLVEPAIRGRHDWSSCEAYTIVEISELRGGPLASEVLAWPHLAKLVLGEASSAQLGAAHGKEVLEYALSYLDRDLVVVDWNSAFVIAPPGSPNVSAVLAFANAQLIGLRYYDDQLDAEIKRLHAELARAARWGAWGSSSYEKLAHQIAHRLVSMTEVTERVDNTIKVVGNFYLSRVYRAAIARLRMLVWQESIARKQRLVSEVYGMLKGEVELRRSLILELTVVLLIVVEVILALQGHGH